MIKPKRVKWKKPLDLGNDTSDKYYDSDSWRRLRNSYIREHVICEECIKHGHVTPAEHVHHIVPFMSEHNEIARWNTFLNPNNLRALCKHCHYAYHYKMRHYNLLSVNELNDEEWKQAHTMYAE